jgi:LPS sulfotransferase NodH
MEDSPITLPISRAQRGITGTLAHNLQRFGNQLRPSRVWHKCQQLRHQMELRRDWWLRPHTPFRAIFVIATPRSGSNLLLDSLRQIPGVWSRSEVLNWGMTIGPSRRASRDQAIRHIHYSLQTLTQPYRGCKLFLGHLRHYQLTLNDILAEFPDARFLVLYRQSLAEQYASYLMAKETRQWMLLQGQSQKRAPIHVDPGELRRYCDQMRRDYHEVLSVPWLPSRAVLFSYEELSADPARCLREQICPLLGVPPIEPATRICKQNPQALADRVDNYRQVAPLLNSPLCQQHYTFSRQQARRAA